VTLSLCEAHCVLRLGAVAVALHWVLVRRTRLTPKRNEFPASWQGRCYATALHCLEPYSKLHMLMYKLVVASRGLHVSSCHAAVSLASEWQELILSELGLVPTVHTMRAFEANKRDRIHRQLYDATPARKRARADGAESDVTAEPRDAGVPITCLFLILPCSPARSQSTPSQCTGEEEQQCRCELGSSFSI